jgi:hypothetical protein
MKRLRKFALSLDRDQWPPKYAYRFYLRSRAMCNYIERALAKEPVALVDSSKLVIKGSLHKEVVMAINSEKIAVLKIPFAAKKFSKVEDDERASAAFICSYATQSLDLVQGASSDEVRKIQAWIEEFSDGGFVNCWCHQQRKQRAKDITARLECHMDSKSFQLYLHVGKGEREVIRRRILKTDPDELAFQYRLPDMKITANRLTVTDWQGKPIYQKSLNAFR